MRKGIRQKMIQKNTPRIRSKFETEIVPLLLKEFVYTNKLAVPRIKKIVVNSGIGEALKNKELLGAMKKDLMMITGQMPSERQAKVSVASFGVRRGMVVGLKVTLRGNRMYYFLDKLLSIVLPRLRDFRGVSLKSFDKFGNYTLGLQEHTVFPEIDLTKSQAKGLEISIVTSARNLEEGKRMLELIGMPFEKVSK